MQAFRNTLREGWLEARWGVYFLVLLLPVLLILGGLVALAAGTATPSPWVLLVLGPLAAGIALLGAALWDGPTGHVGRPIWLMLALLIGILLIRAYLRNRRQQQETTVRLRGRPLTVALTTDVIARLTQRQFRYRDLLRLHPVRVAEDRVLIGV
jgi:hypothetical protein